jgi:hypothetical protein
MFAIITATASTLGLHKGTDITSAAQAAGALRAFTSADVGVYAQGWDPHERLAVTATSILPISAVAVAVKVQHR